jgi:phosphate transport system substrate-binding protein
MKKSILLITRIILTAVLLIACTYIVYTLEYWSQLKAVDNLIGAAPLILLFGLTGLLIALLWKRNKKATTSTISLLVLAAIWGLLLIPAATGNWYPLSVIPDNGSASPDMTVYKPFAKDTQVAKLPTNASINIHGKLPLLDGATALYPVYSAFANAVYNEADYFPNVVVCTNTANAYNSIISGDCDIIFVAKPSEKQMQAAKAAGAELIFTSIGREALVFLTGDSNPIDGLTYQQLKNIYSGKTNNWKTLGWDNGGDIIAFQRPEGSGSQTGLQNIMGTLPVFKPRPLPDDSLIGTGSMMKQVSVEWHGVQPAIGYSYRYYAVTMYPNPDSKLLKINGVYPSRETIVNGSYPFASDFYAVTNGQPTGNVKQLIDWILSDEGQYLIEKTGYAPILNYR